MLSGPGALLTFKESSLRNTMSSVNVMSGKVSKTLVGIVGILLESSVVKVDIKSHLVLLLFQYLMMS